MGPIAPMVDPNAPNDPHAALVLAHPDEEVLR